MVGSATAKLREPKHVRTRGIANKIESDERSLRDRTYQEAVFYFNDNFIVINFIVVFTLYFILYFWLSFF